MKAPRFGNPNDQKYFEAMCARAMRQQTHQRLLWRRLRAAMAEGRRGGQSPAWRARFIKLLERTARHERLLAYTFDRGFSWIGTRRMKPKAPALRVVRGGKR